MLNFILYCVLDICCLVGAVGAIKLLLHTITAMFGKLNRKLDNWENKNKETKIIQLDSKE